MLSASKNGLGGSAPTTTTESKENTPQRSTMPSLSEMSATSSSAFVEECSQFQGSYGSYEKSNSNVEEENRMDTNDSCSTFWDLLLSLYLPLMLLWLRRGMFGTANLVRSLVLGHCLRLLFGNFSEWMTDKAPSWLHTLVQPPSTNGKMDPHAWPPPALTALALLTVFALVVHPDGFTWIMLGKLRQAMLSMFQSSTQCWGVIVKDYGVIPTVAASATLAALVFLLLVMIRTLAPRRPKRTALPQEKKKKKRKGHARHRGAAAAAVGGGDENGGGGAQIGSGTSTSNMPSTLSNVNDSPKELPALSSTSKSSEKAPELTPLTPISSSRAEDPMPKSSSSNSPEGKITSTTESRDTDTLSMPLCPAKPNEKDSWRVRVSSVSTLDTTALSDDQSCGSTSIRSVPSASVNSSIFNEDQEASVPPSKPKPSSNNPRCQKRGDGKPKIKSPKANDAVVASSRWDALKPNHHAHHHNQNHSHLYHQNGNDPHHKNKGRRGGHHKKGRSRHHPAVAPNSDSFFSRTTTSPSPTSPLSKTHQIPSAVLSPVSPPSRVNQTMNQNLPVPSSLPPPPPGLGPLPVGGRILESQQANKNSVLFPSIQNPGLLIPMTTQQQEHIPFVSNSFAEHNNSNRSDRNEGSFPAVDVSQQVSTPPRFGTRFPNPQYSPAGSIPYGTTIKENPFAAESNYQADLDSQIEADLQELGGQMAGSILDF